MSSLFDSTISAAILLSFFSFFAVLSPINFVVVSLSMTTKYTQSEKKLFANKSLLLAFIIVFISMLTGKYIFDFLNIDLYAFKIGGGFLLGLNGFNMIFGKDNEAPSDEQVKGIKEDTKYVFPLAIPILGGPGAISTSIILINSYSTFELKMIVILCLIANFVLIAILVQISGLLSKYIKPSFFEVLYRISGLLVASLGTNSMLSGIIDSHLFN